MANRKNSPQEEPDSGDRSPEHVPDKEAEAIQNVRDVLRGKINTSLKPKERRVIDTILEETSWKIKVAACETKEDFLRLFALHGISEEIWRNSTKLRQAGYDRMYREISTRFTSQDGWKGFILFMGTPNKCVIDKNILKLSCPKQVAACETREDFLTLFSLHKIPENVWRKSTRLALMGFANLYTALSRRFEDQGGWDGFNAFMGPSVKPVINKDLLKLPKTEQVAACETREDFLALFALLKIDERIWRNSETLSNEGHKTLYETISKRFSIEGGWKGFLKFMQIQTEVKKSEINTDLLKFPATKQVAACETREDFLALFALCKIPSDSWRSSNNLQKAGFSGLYVAIMQRFRLQGGWEAFKAFMGPSVKPMINKDILKLSTTEQVAACETREDFLALFALLKIDERIWRNSGNLRKKRYTALSQAISKRFSTENGWKGFVDFIDGKDEASLEATIERLSLEEAIALLGHQPNKLKAYLSVSHPNLLPEDIDHLVSHAFKRLHARRDYDYSDFTKSLSAPKITQSLKRTADAAASITGIAPGADCVLIEGTTSTRRIKVAEDGTFQVRASLTIGARNDLRIFPINHEKRQIGPATELTIHQTGEPDDIEALICLLDQMGRDVLEGIRTDPGRHEYVVRQAELVLIRKFSGSFAKGKAYVEGLIANAKTPTIRKILKQVLKRFMTIDAMEHPNVKKGAPLYFFQKYCVAEIQRAIADGKNGIVLANDPGLGKTRTALVAINGDPATIIAPNSVVSSWAEEAQRALNDADILVLRDMHSRDRKNLLRTSTARHCVTNVDFLRSVEGDERYGLLSNEETIVVQDEAHGLLNLQSEQSKGARRLKQKFLLLLSATPAKDPKTLRRILHLLEPEDPRFKNDKAFMKAFPGNDPKALKTLSVLKQQYMIRFTKEDVLETMDPNKPLSQQKHRLPRKEYIPEESMGGYTLTEDQCQATYELLLDFPEWTQTYDRYVPKDAVAREDQLRGNSNALVKTHALRQTANNPSYIGSKTKDPKAKQLLKTVETFLAEGRKVVIFCQYNAQAEKYAELLKAHCPSVYTGLTSKQGYRMGSDGKQILYKKNVHGAWEMDNRGLPKVDPNGEPMSSLDYERLAFQNAPERRVMISTYAAGSVGVTFTAGKATIFDDLPDDVVKEIQSEDRTHRIDHEHQTHHSVKYVRMVAHYPKNFLEQMKQIWVRKKSDGTYEEVTNSRAAEKERLDTAYDTFFAQGTYDEVRLAGLKTQRMRFRLINDGIADESEMPEIKDLI